MNATTNPAVTAAAAPSNCVRRETLAFGMLLLQRNDETLLTTQPFHLVQIHGPVERGAAPNLPHGTQCRSLIKTADAQRIRLRIAECRRVDGRSTIRTKAVRALRAAFGYFDVHLRLTAK